MSYGIMRCEKRGGGAIGGIEAENNRVEKISLPASEVDWEKTPDNIFLVKSDDWRESIKAELSNHGIEKYRKDAILMIDTLYTASPEFFQDKTPEETVQYFKDCLDFHNKEFGHVFNAVIHLDETTPHMHIVSVPIVERGEGFALSAKEMLGNRKDFHERQNHFYEEVSEKWDLERGEIRDPTEKREHLDTLRFKIEQETKDYNSLKVDIFKAREDLIDLYNTIDDKEKKIGSMDKISLLIDSLVERLEPFRHRIIDALERVAEKFESIHARVWQKEIDEAGLVVESANTENTLGYVAFKDGGLMKWDDKVIIVGGDEIKGFEAKYLYDTDENKPYTLEALKKENRNFDSTDSADQLEKLVDDLKSEFIAFENNPDYPDFDDYYEDYDSVDIER